MQRGEGPAAAPTGCFKCGRPGHWSRDCPSSAATISNSVPNSSKPNANPNPTYSSSSFKQSFAGKGTSTASAKKAPRSRPKLTPDLLLSDEGLGYVLRHFPRAFKYHGRGHEVTDLGNLIGMYADWHSRLLPYYSFDQFIQKVEKVGATRRVRRCIVDLRERVARGGDPTKLYEPPVELVDADKELDQHEEGMNVDEPFVEPQNQPLEGQDADHLQEELINEIYHKATEDSCPPHQESPPVPQCLAASVTDSMMPASTVEQTNHAPDDQQKEPRKIQVTEEQKARMLANRLKAFERAKLARSSSHAS
ncbi:hypothetical protein AXF42_Ash019918 [Apostasia shenzhenica]|uniref:CCHC-type domain-containing protein n=1 Tax=Apostasia shenzhenica TaxID=1088818 RepID=A0A2H9ZYW4_9ASPA|nr:hypothetical protein AXF42_Ash019918 [Apostasia shenzhenica]